MGAEAQFMAYILPPTYFMEIVRGIYLKGLGPSFYLPQLLALGLFTAVFLGLAIRRVRKRVD
jgi:ABC-2 type transport system permease protein